MNLRRLIFSLAALLLLGLITSPATVGAQSAPIQPVEFVDSDGDGLSDADEATYSTDPNTYDTDGDGYGDNQEVVNGSDPLDDNSIPANGQPGADTDGDLLSDETENQIGTDSTKPDTDDDQLTDFAEVGFEPGSSTGTDPLLFDTDGDGLGDGSEYLPGGWGTDPIEIDTDADGYNDGDELFVYGTDPKDAASVPAGQGASTMIVELRLLPAEYAGNDYIGDSEPLAGVDVTVAIPASEFGVSGTTDETGHLVFGGLGESEYAVILGVPGDFADFITVFGTEDGFEPRQHDGQNTNHPVVYLGPNETLYATLYVIPVDARGDDPAPAPAPQSRTPVTTPITALPNTGAGNAATSTDLNTGLALVAGMSVLLGLAGIFGLARHRA